MKKSILEKLVEGDWDEVGPFGECEIYRKRNKRVLYEPKTDEIYMSYNFEDTATINNANNGGKDGR